MAPMHVCVTAPPGRFSPVLEAGRVVAGCVHWGVSGGFVAISVYLRDGEGLQGGNLSTVWRAVEFLHELNSRGVACWRGAK